MRILDAPEAQRIRHGHDLGAHAKHVAHDAADAGRRAFERHDLRRMVVRLVRDHDAVAFARVFAQMHDARILTRSDHDVGTVGRQLL